MNKCPYCGFELKEGDVFCMNCGAALDEDFSITYEPKKKKKHTALWIILGAVLVLIAGGVIYALNRPELILANAAKKTADELEKDEGLGFITETLEHGSVEVNMELGDILSGFSIPLLSEIDARAGVKVYNDSENSEHLIQVTGSLGGSSALGADIWVSPEHMILKSPTFIGRDAYGIALDERDSREEAEALIKQYAGLDLEEYDKYIPAAQKYLGDKKNIDEKLLKKVYLSAFKYGDVKTEKITYDFGKGDEKTKVISISLNRSQIIEIMNEVYDWAREEEDLEDFVNEIDQKWLEDIAEMMDDDFSTEYRFYIDADGRLARVETETEGVDTSSLSDSLKSVMSEYQPENKGTVTTAVQYYDSDFSASVNVGDVSLELEYLLGRNNRTDYTASLGYRLSIGRTEDNWETKDSDGLLHITEYSINYAGECEFSWEKDSGRWDLYADGGVKATGELYYDSTERKAEGIISKIRCGDFTFEPNANIIVIAHDEMPEAPDYKIVASQDDVDEFVELVMGNVQSLISEFMADYMGDLLGGISNEIPQESVPEIPETETIEEAVEETLPEIPTEVATESEAETETETIEVTQLASKSDADKAKDGKVEKESEGQADLKADANSGSKADAGVKAETESETVKKPDKPVKGTYYYDDGKKFSIDFSTGKYTEHITVKATLHEDGTYELVYSNGVFSYNDEGTYDRDSKNNMTFASSTGIDATGKYYDDYIEVTIPGYITEKLIKID